MLYETYEAEISKGTLPAVLAGIDEPVCLLGGWAVYLAVNSRYKKARGRDYHGLCLGTTSVQSRIREPADPVRA